MTNIKEGAAVASSLIDFKQGPPMQAHGVYIYPGTRKRVHRGARAFRPASVNSKPRSGGMILSGLPANS